MEVGPAHPERLAVQKQEPDPVNNPELKISNQTRPVACPTRRAISAIAHVATLRSAKYRLMP